MVTLTGGAGLGCHLAINDLPLELGRLREGETYWIAFANEADSAALAVQTLRSAEPDARAALICSTDPSGLLAGLRESEGPADLRTFRLSGAPARALQALTKDLDRSLRPRRRTIIIRLSTDYFADENIRLEALLSKWRAWLQANGCVILVITYGEHAMKAVHALQPLSNVLSGLAFCKPSGPEYSYGVLFWRNALASVGQTYLQLAATPAGFSVVHQQAPMKVGADRDRFLFERVVLEGVPVYMADDWHVYDTVAALTHEAMQANAATVVFGLKTGADLAFLARTLHTLRAQRGPALKLVIREMNRTLRYQDEQLLLACGATLVISADTALPRFLSLLETVQGKTYTRELADDPEVLIARNQAPKLRGIISAERFIAYVQRMLEQEMTGSVSGVLVAMKPVPGLSPALAMGQLQLRRYGDVACELGGLVYVYLFGCHPNLVDVALGNVFGMPYREIFSDHAAYMTSEQTLSEYERMKLLYDAPLAAFPVATDPRETAAQAGATQSSADLHRHRPAPVLAALPLAGGSR